MKTKLIFSTENQDIEYWTEMPYLPRVKEYIHLIDFLKDDEIENIKKSAVCWSGERGAIDSIEHRCDNSDFYAEIVVWCED